MFPRKKGNLYGVIAGKGFGRKSKNPNQKVENQNFNTFLFHKKKECPYS